MFNSPNRSIGDTFQRRLGLIQQLAPSYTMRAPQQQQRRQSSGGNSAPSYRPVGSSGGGGSELERFIRAISDKESGGNYKAVNRHSGASGKYQIMPSNIPSWSKQALGRSVSRQEFLNNPEIQERIARHQLTNYYKQWGAGGAAVAWYAGPGRVKNYLSGGKGLNKSQGQYPTINSYAAAILRRMGQG